LHAAPAISSIPLHTNTAQLCTCKGTRQTASNLLWRRMRRRTKKRMWSRRSRRRRRKRRRMERSHCPPLLACARQGAVSRASQAQASRLGDQLPTGCSPSGSQGCGLRCRISWCLVLGAGKLPACQPLLPAFSLRLCFGGKGKSPARRRRVCGSKGSWPSEECLTRRKDGNFFRGPLARRSHQVPDRLDESHGLQALLCLRAFRAGTRYLHCWE